MKPINFQTTFKLVLAGAAAALIAGCGAEPQVIVVTATPAATPLVITATPAPTAVVELAVKPPTPALAESYEAGALLRGSGETIFYVTTEGTLRPLADPAALPAFGLDKQTVFQVTDAALAALPQADPLTRLSYDAEDNLYWIAGGQRWQVNDWKKVVERADYAGIRPTPLDGSLAASLPLRAGFSEGMLLRADGQLYFYNQNALVRVTGGLSGETAVLDIPAEVVAVYPQRSEVEQAQVRLTADTAAANVRQAPDLQAEVLGTVQNSAHLVALGRTADGSWLQIIYRGQPGWLAADLAAPSVALRLLPVVSRPVAVATDLPEAEPAAVVVEPTSTPQPQPLFCADVPIRGFGKVWSEHKEVKATLGCADSWQGGEQATQAAVQLFENGLMVWLQADGYYSGDPVYVFFADGSYQRFGDLGPADPLKVEPVPEGFFAVGDKFSKVYWEGTGAQVKERLGYAIGPAKDSAGAFQNFSNGRMFWTETLDRIFVVYEYGYFEGNTYIMVRTWHSYEDTF